MVAVFIKPDVGLELRVTYGETEHTAGKFVVTGPKRKLDILKYVAQGIDKDGEGVRVRHITRTSLASDK